MMYCKLCSYGNCAVLLAKHPIQTKDFQIHRALSYARHLIAELVLLEDAGEVDVYHWSRMELILASWPSDLIGLAC